MKPHSTASILAAVAVTSLAGMALLAPIHQAMAAKGGNARAAMTQTKVDTSMHGGTGGNAKADAVRATTTGTKEKRCLPGSGGMCRK